MRQIYMIAADVLRGLGWEVEINEKDSYWNLVLTNTTSSENMPESHKSCLRGLLRGWLMEFNFEGGRQQVNIYKELHGLDPEDDRYSCLDTCVNRTDSNTPLYKLNDREVFVRRKDRFDRYVLAEPVSENITTRLAPEQEAAILATISEQNKTINGLLEKARRYDGAIQRARQFMETPYLENSDDVAGYIFPELKESEDERIRKAMIDFFKHEREEGITVLHYGVNIERMIAWLERQGEQPKKHDVCDNCDQQGGCVSPCPMKLVEKQGEQNLADKPKPKFKVGDIITNGVIIGKVDENENGKYHGWFGYDNKLSVHYADIPDIENWNLWTIKDAKPGDVVMCDECSNYPWIGLVKSYNSEDNLDVYCYIEAGHNHIRFNSRNHTTDNMYPATKEQRDLLFQKMREAGYEWDAGKLELRKVEQKQKIQPKFKIGDIIRFKGNETLKGEAGTHKIVSYDNELYVFADGTTDLFCEQDLYELVERKPAWSEEEEKNIDFLIHLIEHNVPNHSFAFGDGCAYGCKSKEEAINMLKSLKERYTWKPSDKQMEALKEAGDEHWELDGLDPLYTLYQDLKKLKG